MLQLGFQWRNTFFHATHSVSGPRLPGDEMVILTQAARIWLVFAG